MHPCGRLGELRSKTVNDATSVFQRDAASDSDMDFDDDNPRLRVNRAQPGRYQNTGKGSAKGGQHQPYDAPVQTSATNQEETPTRASSVNNELRAARRPQRPSSSAATTHAANAPAAPTGQCSTAQGGKFAYSSWEDRVVNDSYDGRRADFIMNDRSAAAIPPSTPVPAPKALAMTTAAESTHRASFKGSSPQLAGVAPLPAGDPRANSATSAAIHVASAGVLVGGDSLGTSEREDFTRAGDPPQTAVGASMPLPEAAMMPTAAGAPCGQKSCPVVPRSQRGNDMERLPGHVVTGPVQNTINHPISTSSRSVRSPPQRAAVAFRASDDHRKHSAPSAAIHVADAGVLMERASLGTSEREDFTRAGDLPQTAVGASMPLPEAAMMPMAAGAPCGQKSCPVVPRSQRGNDMERLPGHVVTGPVQNTINHPISTSSRSVRSPPQRAAVAFRASDDHRKHSAPSAAIHVADAGVLMERASLGTSEREDFTRAGDPLQTAVGASMPLPEAAMMPTAASAPTNQKSCGLVPRAQMDNDMESLPDHVAIDPVQNTINHPVSASSDSRASLSPSPLHHASFVSSPPQRAGVASRAAHDLRNISAPSAGIHIAADVGVLMDGASLGTSGADFTRAGPQPQTAVGASMPRPEAVMMPTAAAPTEQKSCRNDLERLPGHVATGQMQSAIDHAGRAPTESRASGRVSFSSSPPKRAGIASRAADDQVNLYTKSAPSATARIDDVGHFGLLIDEAALGTEGIGGRDIAEEADPVTPPPTAVGSSMPTPKANPPQADAVTSLDRANSYVYSAQTAAHGEQDNETERLPDQVVPDPMRNAIRHAVSQPISAPSAVVHMDTFSRGEHAPLSQAVNSPEAAMRYIPDGGALPRANATGLTESGGINAPSSPSIAAEVGFSVLGLLRAEKKAASKTREDAKVSSSWVASLHSCRGWEN